MPRMRLERQASTGPREPCIPLRKLALMGCGKTYKTREQCNESLSLESETGG